MTSASSSPSRDEDCLSAELVGEMVGGTYLVVDFISRGASGVVFKAVQLSVGRFVALKILQPSAPMSASDPHFAERFELEATTYGKLRHPNTVTLHDFGEHVHDGRTLYYMAMEYVRGRTIREDLHAEGRFRPARAIDVTLQIVRSLREAHGLGIVHRDLKPGNVMLADSEEGQRVKVLDFGVAKVDPNREIDPDQRLTLDGIMLGSPHYMAPEQITLGPVDGRTDIYALGCLLFEMLAGAPPFQGNGSIEVCAAHLSQAPPSLASVAGRRLDVTPDLESIVRRCLRKRPEDRYRSVEELSRALGSLHDDDRAQGSIVRTRESLEVPRRRRFPRVWVAAVVVLVLGAGTLLVTVFGLLVVLSSYAAG